MYKIENQHILVRQIQGVGYLPVTNIFKFPQHHTRCQFLLIRRSYRQVTFLKINNNQVSARLSTSFQFFKINTPVMDVMIGIA